MESADFSRAVELTIGGDPRIVQNEHPMIGASE
jgi:hypothetical protein